MTGTEHRPADTEGGVITVDQYLRHPPARVWKALTDSGQFAAWFMPNDFVPVVGRAFTLHRSANCDLRFSSSIACRVLAIEPERLLSYSWTDGGEYAGDLSSTVTWTLSPEGRGTRVFLEHRGFRPDDPIHMAARNLMDQGWHVYIGDRLAGHLDRTASPAA
jgi:uncharacterized protein YndB with AHSA1/START domain